MHRATGQGSSSSSSSLLQHLSSEGSSSTGRNTGGQGSNSNHIDLTQARPPRIVHPRILPSQTIEIIDLSSDDESSYSDHYTRNNNFGSSSSNDIVHSDDEVQFVRETPGTAIAPPGNSSNTRQIDTGISGSDSYSMSQTSSFPGSETLLHAYHLGRHPSFQRSQETPGLTRNRSEDGVNLLIDRGGSSNSRIPPLPRRPSPFFHPYVGTNALPTRHPSAPTRASGSGLISAFPSTNRATELRALASAMRTPPRQHPPNSRSDPVAEFQRTEQSIFSIFARMLAEEGQNSLRAAGRRNNRHHMFTHTHHHYWDDDWGAPNRERSPSVLGELLERFGAFDGAPPAATEAEIERERNAIETKPVLTRPGFTKTIDPETVITCPLCTKELGHDGDKKPTLWVIVGCGHVVCGICAEEMFISRKLIRGTTAKGRRQSMSRKVKGKGKAKWSPGPADMETGGDGEDLDTTSDGIAPISPTSTTATLEANIKVTKKVMGSCPGCQRKIRNTSLQQLYL